MTAFKKYGVEVLILPISHHLNGGYQIQYIACSRYGLSEVVHLLYDMDLESCYLLLLLLVASNLPQRYMEPQRMKIASKVKFIYSLYPHS